MPPSSLDNTTPLDANRARWSGAGGFYEVWYATLSDPKSRVGFWIRYTLEAPDHDDPYAQLWFGCFDGEDPRKTFAINKKLPVRELTMSNEPFRVRIGDAELRMDGMRGHLAGNGHSAEWDLRWSPSEKVHFHLPDLSYVGRWAETQVLSPQLDVHARGRITVDGRALELDGAPLGQTHLWGRKHAYSWAWSHCNAFTDAPGCALETLSLRLKRGPLVMPKLTLLTLYLDGKPIEFRQFHDLPLTRSEYGTGRYWLEATGAHYKIEAELTCRPEDMVQAEYVDPDGEPAWCHNTECADARVRVWKRGAFGWREIRTLVADKTAHYEWGARAGDPLVKKRHVTIE